MKKICSLLVTIVAIFGLVGCFDLTGSSFEISGYPKTTYVLEEKFSWEGVSVKIGSEYYNYEQAKNQGVEFPEVDNIPTHTAGTYSLSVKYENLTATFQYTVLDSYFANGDGTLYNPYQISTFTQLKAMGKVWDQKTYFVLINDIDMSSNTAGMYTSNIVLDGQGYALRNVNCQVFETIIRSTVKNLDVYFGKDRKEFEGDYQGIFASRNYSVTYENINTYGRILVLNGINVSLYGFASVFSVQGQANTVTGSTNVLKNCNNYADIIGVNTREVSIFTNGALANNGNYTYLASATWYVLGCKNYGTAYGQSAALMTCNPSYLSNLTYVIDDETVNYGKIISTLNKSDVFYTNTGNSYADRWTNANYSDEWTYITAKFTTSKKLAIYAYDETIGVKEASEVSTAGFASFDQSKLDNLSKVDMLFYDLQSDDTMKLVVDSDNNLVFTCSKDNEVAYYQIKMVGTLHYRDLDGNIPDGFSGNTTEGAYWSTTCDTVDAINGLGLKKYSFQNVVHSGDVLPTFENQGNFIANVVNKIYTIEESSYDESGTIPTITIDGKVYYAYNIVGEDAYTFTNPVNGQYVGIVVTAMDANGLPLGSCDYWFKVE